MAAFVADASVTLPWCFQDEATAWMTVFWIVFAEEIGSQFPLIGRRRFPMDC